MSEELKKRLEETEEMLFRLRKAVNKPAWEEGETIEDAMEESNLLLHNNLLDPESDEPYWEVLEKRIERKNA